MTDEVRAWPLLPWHVRACLRGLEGYCRALGWCSDDFRTMANLLRRAREEGTVGEWLEGQREEIG